MHPNSDDVADEAAWLDIAAGEKASSVTALAPSGVKTVVESGAGSGAVLSALDKVGFAEQYYACEPSSLFGKMRPMHRLVGAANTTFDQAFGDRTFDLAILSHVVEHLLTPAVLVSQALERARFVIVEVPLDGSPAGNARAWLRKQKGVARLDNDAGHVQFFSRRSARDLVTHSGGIVNRTRGYFPRAAYAARSAGRYHNVVLQLARIETLARHYHEHYAILCTKRTLDSWQHVFVEPV